MVEVILGISILTLILGITFTKINLDDYKINSFLKQITTDIRYVRKLNKIGNKNIYIRLSNEGGAGKYSLMEGVKETKSVYLPKGVELIYSTQSIKFNSNGTFQSGGTTISIIQNGQITSITIVPASGRVLLKEGIYET